MARTDDGGDSSLATADELNDPSSVPTVETPDAARMKALVKHELFGAEAEAPRIGRFALLRRVGAGGMGVVYAAYDEQLDRKVAVKVISGHGRDGLTDERLLREARALARLSHPNVVTVHEVGSVGGQVFVAMEFVQGLTLDDWSREHHPDWRHTLEVMLQAGRGLCAAHDAGVVHRDFKPANVIVGDDGRVRVLDFGLARGVAGDEKVAKADAQPPRARERPLGIDLTQTGQLLGTPAYMSPEQMRGDAAGAASDQFSYCVTLWEALYGARPFAAKDARALAEALERGQRQTPADRRGVPAWLHRILCRGLAITPEERWPSMHALVSELSRDRVRVRRRAGVAVTLVGLLAAAAYLLFGQRAAYAPSATAAELAQKLAQRRADELIIARARTALGSDPSTTLAWLKQLSADTPLAGAALALAREARVKGVARLLIGHTDDVERVVATPDGRVISASDDFSVRVWNIETGTGRVLTGHTAPIEMIAVTPDGTRLGSASADHTARVWNLATGVATVLRGHRATVRGIAFSPRGDEAATVSDDRTLRLWTLKTGASRVIGQHRAAIEAVAFSPDGTLLLSGAHDGSLGMWDPRTGRGRAVSAHFALVRVIVMSPAGDVIATGGEDGRIRLWTREGRPLRELRGHADLVRALLFTPDGKRLLSAGGDRLVRVHDLATGSSRALEGNTSGIKGIALSPDGRLIAAAGIDRGVRVWPIDGGAPRLFSGHTASVKAVTFVGSRVLVSASDDNYLRVWQLDGGELPAAGAKLRGWLERATNVTLDLRR